MRKLPAVIAALGLVAVALVGCSSASDAAAACGRVTDSDPSTMKAITVSGPANSAPDVSVHTPFHTSTTEFADVKTGSGSVAVTTNAQLVVLDVTLASAETGKVVAKTAYDGSGSLVQSVKQWGTILPGFKKALHCATAGSRIAVALAPDGIGKDFAESAGLTSKDSLVAVVDVHKVYLAAADGSLVYNSGWGLPAVVRAPNGRPGVIVPDGPAPQNLTIQLLKSGSGEKVTGKLPVRVHETVVNWSDKSVASTTWDGDPKSLTLSSASKGIREALKGQRVGSQVMAIIPKSDGDQGATDTQIVVLDILGIDPAGATASQ